MSWTKRPSANQSHVKRLVLKALNAQRYFTCHAWNAAQARVIIVVCLPHRAVTVEELENVLKMHTMYGGPLTYAEVLEINRALPTFEADKHGDSHDVVTIKL